MNLGNVARVVAVLAACVAAVGSASSTSNQSAITPQGQAAGSPPPAQQMEPGRALGLWRSTFGAVKIEADNSKGGLQTGAVQGVWVYQRQGQEVVGYFAGSLNGNVLQFHWQEPNNPPLTGAGYLVFDLQGRQYSGRWWSDRRDRVGDWNGWRQGAQPQSAPQNVDPYAGQNGGQYGNQAGGQYAAPAGGQYGGQGYADPYRGQYGGQTYGGQPRQPGPYAPQPGPYAPQPRPQPAPQPQPEPRTYY